ncbi:hypothetical protein FCR2A7T_05600 [Flavobacterium cauense R2A-7]|uniref:Lipoprotein n=1 Tax=Flavobacterium cauense R2A-7 TaxID=1341154 RepID=V6S546_9FLAO|nr:hypothetical protein [Flavobacterium cauense]ESU21387.1 hypothetical protein FCR2A7T_05600 [Flavobacterium cauense R2A-7]KGO79191.1 hypothetical protein Q762_14560 [Flavobacterium cauense R2A-7]TWI08038.1 hypothetical protein IP98_02903 [Flavobacterium cauense R2A-7]
MKKLTLFLIIIIFGCSPKENTLESIEIMTYYYIPNEEGTKLITDCVDYSKINFSGNVETMRLIKPNESKYIYIKSKVNSKIISNITEEIKSKSEKFYETKIDTNSLDLYCGPTIRVKAKFNTNKIISFTYKKNETDPRFLQFVKLQNTISRKFIEKHFKIIDSIEITNNKKQFEKFALNLDTLKLPFPNMPKSVNEQIKFPPPNK